MSVDVSILRDTGWVYIHRGNRTEGLWKDPVTGRKYSTGAALVIQKNRKEIKK